MSKTKSLNELDTEANSLLNVTVGSLRGRKGHTRDEIHKIKERYRKEYLDFHNQKEMKTKERLMVLDYVIRSAVEFNELLQNIDQ